MTEYKKVNGIFSELEKHIVKNTILCTHPYTEEDVKIWKKCLVCLDDGMEVELCFWSDSGMYFWDISVDKGMFDGYGHTDFLKYLAEKGLPLENVEDLQGSHWRYGKIDCEDVYRIQYYQEEE